LRVNCLALAVSILKAGGEFRILLGGANNSSCRIDHRGDSVIGGPQDPAGILRRAHADDQQVLIARRAPAKPTVVRNVEQSFRACRGELPDVTRENGLVADERAYPVAANRRHNHLPARLEITRFRRYLSCKQPERPWHELTEGNEIHFVVAADGDAV